MANRVTFTDLCKKCWTCLTLSLPLWKEEDKLHPFAQSPANVPLLASAMKTRPSNRSSQTHSTQKTFQHSGYSRLPFATKNRPCYTLAKKILYMCEGTKLPNALEIPAWLCLAPLAHEQASRATHCFGRLGHCSTAGSLFPPNSDQPLLALSMLCDWID